MVTYDMVWYHTSHRITDITLAIWHVDGMVWYGNACLVIRYVVCIYIYIHTYIHISLSLYIYIYIYTRPYHTIPSTYHTYHTDDIYAQSTY